MAKDSRFQVDRKSGKIEAHPDNRTNERTPHSRDGIGIDPRGTGHKKYGHHNAIENPVQIHGGMAVKHPNIDAHVTGGGNLHSALQSGAVGPGLGDYLSAPPNPKRLAPVKITPGMRSRTSNHTDELHAMLGQKILASAIKSGGQHEFGEFGPGFGHSDPATGLPQTVNSVSSVPAVAKRSPR
jgi:hypothetical protein